MAMIEPMSDRDRKIFENGGVQVEETIDGYNYTLRLFDPLHPDFEIVVDTRHEDPDRPEGAGKLAPDARAIIARGVAWQLLVSLTKSGGALTTIKMSCSSAMFSSPDNGKAPESPNAATPHTKQEGE